MMVIVVDNDENTLDGLRTVVNARKGGGEDYVDGHQFLGTINVRIVEDKLIGGSDAVGALVLDLGLYPKEDNQKMRRFLPLLVGARSPADDEEKQLFDEWKKRFVVLRLAELAYQKGIPCALFTNFIEELQKEGVTENNLKLIFHAEEAFTKKTYKPCAAWIRKKLGLP